MQEESQVQFMVQQVLPVNPDREEEEKSKIEEDCDAKSPIHNQSQEILGSQDLCNQNQSNISNPVSYATSTPFINNALKKKQTHFSSLQLSGGESESSVIKSNTSDSLINKSKPVLHLMSSPSDVEKKLNFSSPSCGGHIASEKDMGALDIPMWCKENGDPSSLHHMGISRDSIVITKDEPAVKLQGKTNFHCEMESEHFDENINNVSSKDSTNNINIDEESSVDSVSVVTSSSVPDIFNPEESLLVSERSVGNTQQNSTCSVYDNLPEMNFDLSGHSLEDEESNSECFTLLQNRVDTGSKEESMAQQATSSTNNVIIENKLDSPACESNISDIDLISYKVGMKVFALWNKVYYPGVIDSIDDSATVTIIFHDDQIVKMPKRNVFSHNFFSQGQKTKVKLSDEYYQNASIMASFQDNNDVHYAVNVDGNYHVVGRNSICFTQVQRQNLLTASNDRDITNSNSTQTSTQTISASHKRRQTEPLYSSGNDFFIATTPIKKSMKCRSPQTLFEGITFYIIPEDAPVLCLPYTNTTSSLEEESGDDFSFNVDDLQKIIDENGGVLIPKLHGRDLQRASKFICIAKSDSPCLQFIYAIIVGIPVLHFDWVHRSLEAKQMKQYERWKYVLPAGTDIFGETVQQDFTKRVPYTPLNLVRLYVHTEGAVKNQNRLLDIILSKVGCQRLFGCMHVSKKTKKLQFDITQVDFVLTLVDSVPHALVEAADLANKKIVTATWFVQCLISNQLYDVSDCSVFRYSDPQSNVQGEGETSINETNTTGDVSLLSLNENESSKCD